ncbi:AfsR/SARP family transcriptional regulator [Terrabacter sp. 2YAF2]|jgi:DNA-binding SARP family transcriptional activator|uniref:AfsR/SARP family transcriptional regulator n=1 Tax=Terrabacter sp. 2YAF2 TaxID=3233026 RepID=UPI003F95AFAD
MTLASPIATRIQLCGPPVIELQGQRLDDRLAGHQSVLLFAYLVLNRHRVSSRDDVQRALWPDGPGHASGLNPLVSKLRKVLGAGLVEGRSGLRLRLPSDAVVDVEAARRAVHTAESQIALAHWKQAWAPAQVAMFITEREFLPGEEAPWIEEERRELTAVALRALQAYAVAALGTGGTELPAAVRAGRRLVRLAPLHESGHQVLMQALAREGNVAEALTVYADLQVLLREELGVSPSASSQRVFEGLLHG